MVATVTYPVAIHLKVIIQGVVRVIKEVVNAEFGTEGTPVVVISKYPLIGDIAISDSRLYNTEITDETAYIGGLQVVQETDDCTG